MFDRINSYPAASAAAVVATIGRIAPAGQQEYRNAHYGFSILYPENFNVSEYDEGDGAWTVSFEDDTSGDGFKIFISPSTSTPTDAFVADDTAVGSTTQMKATHGNYLYEVSTLSASSTWFSAIEDSWKFL